MLAGSIALACTLSAIVAAGAALFWRGRRWHCLGTAGLSVIIGTLAIGSIGSGDVAVTAPAPAHTPAANGPATCGYACLRDRHWAAAAAACEIELAARLAGRELEWIGEGHEIRFPSFRLLDLDKGVIRVEGHVLLFREANLIDEGPV